MRAVQLTAYGDPVEGLNYVDIPEPEAPGSNQVLLGVEFSPVNPSDLLLARGIYGIRPALPTVIGGEGVGRVLAVGAGLENVKVGDRVLAPLSSFTWRGRMEVSAACSLWEPGWRTSRWAIASSRRFPASPGGSEW